MALNATQWRDTIGRATNLLQSANPLIGAYELKKVNPVGLDDTNQTYWSDMSPQQRADLVKDFTDIVDLVIANLQLARAGTPPVDWIP